MIKNAEQSRIFRKAINVLGISQKDDNINQAKHKQSKASQSANQ